MATVTHAISLSDTTDGLAGDVKTYTSGAFTPAAGELLVISVVYTGTIAGGGLAGAVYTATGSTGLTFTLQFSQSAGSAGRHLVMFASDQTTSAVSQTVSVTVDTGGTALPAACTGVAFSVERVAGTSGVSGASTTFAAAGTPSVTFSAASTDAVLSALANGSNPGGVTVPSGWASQADTGFVTPTTGLDVASANSGFSGGALNWGSTSATAGGIIGMAFPATSGATLTGQSIAVSAGTINYTVALTGQSIVLSTGTLKPPPGLTGQSATFSTGTLVPTATTGAITVTQGVTDSDTTNGVSGAATYTTASYTPAANDLLVVFISVASASTNASIVTTLTDSVDGQIFSLVKQLTWNTNYTLYAYVSTKKVAATARTLAVAISGFGASLNPAGVNINVMRVAGMSQVGAAAVKQQNSATGVAAATPAPAFSAAALTTNPTFGVVANATNPATMTPPTGWTENVDVGHATPAHGLEDVYRVSGFTGTTVTWGSTSATIWGSIIVELDASAGAPLVGSSSAAATGTLTPANAKTPTGQSIALVAGAAVAAPSYTLTGSRIANVRAGLLDQSLTVPLIGQSITVSRDTLQFARPITGQSIATAQTAPTPDLSKALTGQSIAAAQTAPAPSLSIALTGQSIGAATGTLTASANVTAALTGQSIAVAQQALVPALALTATGQSVAVAQQSVAPSNIVALTGQSIAAVAGALVPANVLTVTGQSIAAKSGGGALSTGLVDFYGFEDSFPATSLIDSAGTNALGVNGTLTNGAGKVGNALVTAVGGYGSKASPASIDFANVAFAQAMWFKTGATNYAFIGRWDNTNNHRIFTLIMESGVAEFLVSTDGVAWTIASVGSGLNNNAWHLAIGWRSLTDGKIYVQIDNGTPVGVAFSAASNLHASATTALTVGSLDPAGGFYTAAGSLDSGGIWQREWTTADSTALWNGGNGLAYADLTANLVPADAETLTGQSIALSTGTLTVSAGVTAALTGQSFATALGATAPANSVSLVGQSIALGQGTLAESNAIVLAGQSITAATGAINYTVPITGQQITAALGALAESNAAALTGQSIAVTRDALVQTDAPVLSGQSIALATGSLAESSTVPLVGSSIATALTAPAVDHKQAITGLSIATATGTLSPASAGTAALTGQSFAAGLGALSVALTVAPAGQSIGVATGTIAAGDSDVVTGQSIGVAQGSLVPSLALGASGQSIGVTRGLVAQSESVTPAGQSIGVAAGTLTPVIAPALAGQSIAAQTGTLAAGNSLAINGMVVVAGQGTLSESNTIALGGQVIAATVGTIVATTSATATGLQMAAVAGSLVAANVEYLSGQVATLTAGILAKLPYTPNTNAQRFDDFIGTSARGSDAPVLAARVSDPQAAQRISTATAAARNSDQIASARPADTTAAVRPD